jgi:hypothetical protein
MTKKFNPIISGFGYLSALVGFLAKAAQRCGRY